MDGDEVKVAARVRLEVEVAGGACVVVCRGPVCAPQDRACVTRKAVSHGSSLPTAADTRLNSEQYDWSVTFQLLSLPSRRTNRANGMSCHCTPLLLRSWQQVERSRPCISCSLSLSNCSATPIPLPCLALAKNATPFRPALPCLITTYIPRNDAVSHLIMLIKPSGFLPAVISSSISIISMLSLSPNVVEPHFV